VDRAANAAPTAMNTKIALVDDHHVFRTGLRSIITGIPNLSVVGEAPDARKAYTMIATTKPDVVVLDLMLPDGDGIAVSRELRRRSPEVRILILTIQNSELLVSRALAAGASGFVLKSDEPDEILRGIEAVGSGRRYVSSAFGERAAELIAQVRETAESNDPLSSLSRREREVCDLVLRGLSNQAVADALCISIKTVETHRARINQKLGVHSTGQLIRLAAMQGLLTT
jgi:DNA-binding NarL/FixJ family response regulator